LEHSLIDHCGADYELYNESIGRGLSGSINRVSARQFRC